MSSLLEAFDLLVVGDEPAAYWWMDKCLSYTKAFPRDGKKTYSPPKIAHLSLRSNSEIKLPLSIAKRFDLRTDSPKEIECIFPDRLVTWNQSTLEKLFRIQADSFSKAGFVAHPSSAELAMIRFYIAQSPEVLDFSQGLWRLFGRSESLLPESLLWNAIQLASYSYWKPTPFPKESPVRHIQAKELPDTNWLRLNSHGCFELERSSGSTFSTPLLILAVNGNELAGIRAKCPDLAAFLPSPADFLSKQALYTLTVSDLDSRLLSPLKSLSLLFEDGNLPMAEEIHGVTARHSTNQISIDFLTKFDFSLEEISQVVTSAYRQLVRLIPDLEKSSHTIGLPLSTADSDSEAERLQAIRSFQSVRIPRYSSSMSQSRTLHPKAHLFTPFLNCHLAYPYGQLEAARLHLVDYLGRKRYRKSAHAVEGAALSG